MLELKIKGLQIEIVANNIKIINSYKIKDRKEMKKILEQIMIEKPTCYVTKRSISQMVKEWVVHNRLYKRSLFVSHTQDCDIANKEPLILEVLYFILGM